jgi:hypothetical protein
MARDVSTLNLAETMAALAETAVEGARDAGLSLDGSRESIQQVEELLAHFHGQIAGETIDGVEPPTAEEIEDGSKAYGAYIGEVLRRSSGGEWVLDSENAYPGEGAVVALVRGNNRIFPIDKVKKRLLYGPEDNVWYYFQMIETQWVK